MIIFEVFACWVFFTFLDKISDMGLADLLSDIIAVNLGIYPKLEIYNEI